MDRSPGGKKQPGSYLAEREPEMARDNSLAWIGGLALGAAAMYLLDPAQGRHRRAALQTSLLPQERMRSAPAEPAAPSQTIVQGSRRLQLIPVPDDQLEASVRAALGRLTPHARAIQVTARDGIVLLTGVILEREVGQVLAGLRDFRGLRRVECQLKTVKDTSLDPAFQQPEAPAPEITREHLSVAGRATLGAVGGLLVVWGLRRGGMPGILSAAVGGLLVTRATAQTSPQDGLPAEGGVIEASASVEVAAPVREVFAFWTHLRNLPRFMRHLREVREAASGISHWVMAGPAASAVSWDAEVISLEPFRRMAWRSLPGAAIPNAGEVRFEELAEDRTRVHLSMAYHPPAGPLGQAVAVLFGADPQQQLAADLHRFKGLLEAPGGVRR